MDIFAPDYYHNFTCVAGSCPDSCCKDWCVDVDAEATAFYLQLPGALGEHLRQVLVQTENGSTMELKNGRCPMWRQDGLCQIQVELGHDGLCKTCREFPRLRHDYGDFTELGLELSCPEATKLILSSPCSKWMKTTPVDAEDFDGQTMNTLLRSRSDFLTFLETATLPFPKILTVLLLHAYEVQEELDGGAAAVLEPERCLADADKFPAQGDFAKLQEFFLGLEILTPQWKERLNTPPAHPCWEEQYRSLLHYFICRYWLQAVSDLDILCQAKFIIAACLLIGCLGGDLVETAQLFSKEIENDPDNVEAILDSAYTAPALTDLHLLGLLLV